MKRTYYDQEQRIDEGYILSTGKCISANHGLLSIPHEDDHDFFHAISSGYDDTINLQKYNSDLDKMVPKFTQEEREEIAAEMIRRWTKFADIGM